MLTYFNYYGAGNTGKTKTLNFLISKFKSVATSSTNDGLTRFTFILINGGVKHIVCICTAGDRFDHLYENHRFFEANNAEIMVTASHENHLPYINTYVHSNICFDGRQHKPEKTVADYHEIKSHPVGKNKAKQDAENQKMADYLFELIMQTINI